MQRSKLVVETIGTRQAQGAVPLALQQDFQPPATKHRNLYKTFTHHPATTVTSFVTCAFFARFTRTLQTSDAYFPGLPPLLAVLAILLHPHSHNCIRTS